nr:nucleic acid/nucleotide deaminase domain-containing protein [Cronobacter dublinensis]
MLTEDFEAKGTNYAAIRYTIGGKEHIDVVRNDPGGLHSEEKLIAKYGNQSDVIINEIYSERKPCPSCNPLVKKYSQKTTYSFSYSVSGKCALQSALNKI